MTIDNSGNALLLVTAEGNSLSITVEQYEQFEGYPGLKDELINGEIIRSPQPKPLHQQLAENLQCLLAQIAGRSGYVAKQNSNIRFALAHSMPAPDVFVVAAEVWKEACESERYVSTAPVVVGEIVSPSNRRRPLANKVRLYLQNGVALVIEVHPKERLIICHSPDASTDVFRDGDEIVLPEAVHGTIAVSEIFWSYREHMIWCISLFPIGYVLPVGVHSSIAVTEIFV